MFFYRCGSDGGSDGGGGDLGGKNSHFEIPTL